MANILKLADGYAAATNKAEYLASVWSDLGREDGAKLLQQIESDERALMYSDRERQEYKDGRY